MEKMKRRPSRLSFPRKDRVVLELSNITDEKRERIGMRTVKKSKANPKGGMIERSRLGSCLERDPCRARNESGEMTNAGYEEKIQ